MQFSFSDPELFFSFKLAVNGRETEVQMNRCEPKAGDIYFSANLLRDGEFVNTYTLNYIKAAKDKYTMWKFEEDYVPKELKKLEEVISEAICERL